MIRLGKQEGGDLHFTVCAAYFLTISVRGLSDSKSVRKPLFFFLLYKRGSDVSQLSRLSRELVFLTLKISAIFQLDLKVFFLLNNDQVCVPS